MTEKHNCRENKIVSCDGEIHIHICAICYEYLGETECPERGVE